MAFAYGPTGIPRQALYPLWGEASWNSYGIFYYVSGFIGYLLIGLWLNKFGSEIDLKKSLCFGIPSFIAGFAIASIGFLRRVFICSDGHFPIEGPIGMGVWWETTWGYDTIGVALMTIGLVLLFKNIHTQGVFYNRSLLLRNGSNRSCSPSAHSQNRKVHYGLTRIRSGQAIVNSLFMCTLNFTDKNN